MALKVTTAPTYTGKLTVAPNTGGTQNGQTYKPQPAAPVQQTAKPQVTAPVKYVQPAAPVQQQATAAQIQAAAAAQAAAVAAEVARQKEVKRQEVQSGVDSKTATNAAATKLLVTNSAWAGKLQVGKFNTPKVYIEPKSNYQVAYDKAYQDALNEYAKSHPKKSGISGLWDKFTGGSTQAAREYAASKAAEVSTQEIGNYDTSLNSFLKSQATKKAAIENAKFGSQAEFDKAVNEYKIWESSQIDVLENQRATITARLDAFGSASSTKNEALLAKAFSAAGSVYDKLNNNSWFKYTLGTGSKNVPSVVSFPARAVNFIGNLNTKDRNIYQTGGTSINRATSGQNAWQATYNQRNWNIKPVVDKPYDKAAAWAALQSGKTNGSVQQTSFVMAFKKATNDVEKEKIAQSYWAEVNRANRNANSLQELAADPLNLAGGIGLVLKSKWLGKAAEVGRASKATGWAFKAADSVAAVKTAIAQSPPLKWLGQEHKTAGQKLSETIDNYKILQADKQQELLANLRKLDPNLDLGIFEDLKKLSDGEAKIIQRMVDAKLIPRDQLRLIGNKQQRARLEEIANRWQDFTEKMKLVDNVSTTRFGKGKQTYAPRTSWVERNGKTLDEYNFRLKKRFKGQQNAADFYQGAVDRYFKSSLESVDAANKTKRVKLTKDYGDFMDSARADVSKAYDKTQSIGARTSSVIGAPTRLWKKSVLKYRPAWTVNNILYNTQAGVLAGGSGSLLEQTKMLNPRYWRKAMTESRGTFGGNLNKEIGGKGKLNKFYSGVEDWSRVAAGRAAMKKGMTAEQAVKRVNNYLFDYKTKNWERPLKTVVPFWAFTKNVGKATARMPLDQPLAAQGYNRLDKYQQNQYEKEFASVVPDLKKLGYTDAEIEQFKQDNAKYYKGRLKVGNKWITTPFNAFSEKSMSNIGFNPYLAAGAESANSLDQYKQTLKGKDASIWARIASKFPQFGLFDQARKSLDLATGKAKPSESWISKPGADGFGLTKTKQGFYPTQPNYVKSMDARQKLGQNALAFLGVPRSIGFDKNQLIQSKTLQKATESYFATDWKNMPYDQQQKEQAALFAKYGMTADDFYKGVLAKYDSENTKKIKASKESAAAANKSLFEQYMAQPKGTRNAWATNKLRELVTNGYFDSNPFLKSFDWINPGTVAKADKQVAYAEAKRTGNWAAYNAKFGKSTKRSEKSIAWSAAKKSGDWSAYRAKYGTKQSAFSYDGKYFKTADSMNKYKEGKFWSLYAKASKEERKQLLADNSQYNTRSNWTSKQWNDWRASSKAAQREKIKSVNGFTAKYVANLSVANSQSATYKTNKTAKQKRKVAWKMA